MRAGPLSNPAVINLLNRYFVPVYTSNEDFTEAGPALPEEKRFLKKVFSEGYSAKESVGTVHVYVLSPTGDFYGSLHVAEAAKTSRLLPLLEKAVQSFKPVASEPVSKPRAQSRPPPVGGDSLLLHLTARALGGGGAWGDFPVENWIVLGPADWRNLLPPGKATVGSRWEMPPETTSKLLVYFYPATENNDSSKNVIERQSLEGVVTAESQGIITAKLTGSLKMKHSFYGRPDTNVVAASISGFVEFDPNKREIKNLQMVTDKATYGGGKFGIAVRSFKPDDAELSSQR